MLMYGRGQYKVVQQLFSDLKKHQISEVFYITLEYFYLDIYLLGVIEEYHDFSPRIFENILYIMTLKAAMTRN